METFALLVRFSLQQLGKESAHGVDDLDFPMVPILRQQLLCVFDVFGDVFVVTDTQIVPAEQLQERLHLTLFEVVSENDVALLAEVVRAVVQNFDQIDSAVAWAVDFALEVEPKEAVYLLRLSLNLVISQLEPVLRGFDFPEQFPIAGESFYISGFQCFCDVIYPNLIVTLDLSNPALGIQFCETHKF